MRPAPGVTEEIWDPANDPYIPSPSRHQHRPEGCPYTMPWLTSTLGHCQDYTREHVISDFRRSQRQHVVPSLSSPFLPYMQTQIQLWKIEPLIPLICSVSLLAPASTIRYSLSPLSIIPPPNPPPHPPVVNLSLSPSPTAPAYSTWASRHVWRQSHPSAPRSRACAGRAGSSCRTVGRLLWLERLGRTRLLWDPWGVRGGSN